MKSHMRSTTALLITLILSTSHAYSQASATRPTPVPHAAANQKLTPTAKARLGDRLHQLTDQYAALKPKTLVNVTVRSTHPALTQTQSDIVSATSEIETLQQSVKAQLDSTSELTQAESQRLQMAMDRLSKLMGTLSNLLKKISDTEAALAQNIK